MSKPNILALAMRSAAEPWPILSGSGDPNLVDVYWLAKSVTRALGLSIPSRLPEREIGIKIVECVESTLVRGTLVRSLPHNVLSDRGLWLVRRIRNGKLLDYLVDRRLLYDGAGQTYVSAFYTWHGCLNMAKTLRRTYVTERGEAPYTAELRKQGYGYIQRCTDEEDASGNPWVKFGVMITRDLARGRNNEIVDDWVPKDSPYWK